MFTSNFTWIYTPLDLQGESCGYILAQHVFEFGDCQLSELVNGQCSQWNLQGNLRRWNYKARIVGSILSPHVEDCWLFVDQIGESKVFVAVKATIEI